MPLPADLPEHLHPRLVLFLSADVVGSTALKQPDRGKATSQEVMATAAAASDRQMEINWLDIFEAFYARVAEGAGKHWYALATQCCQGEEEIERYLGPCPVFWKTNGDEVLFYKVLTDSRQIHFAIEWWKRTIHFVRSGLDRYRDILREAGIEPLDLKATAWTAGFPRRNKQIHSDYGLGIAVDSYGKFADVDASAREEKPLEAVAAAEPADRPEPEPVDEPSNKAKKPYYDFIGPGIDIGFRLSGLSSTQKMAVSLDVAYILARAHFNVDAGILREKIYYDGRTFLKGVFEGKRYPVFWLNISRKGSFEQIEVDIQSPIEPDKVADICAKYYRRYEGYTHRPFIWQDPTQTISEVPQKFIDWLERANSAYQLQVATQAKVSEGVKSIANTAGDIAGEPRPEILSEATKELAKIAKTIGRAGSEGEGDSRND